MLKCRKVAITGGMSSGKSSVCHILADLGAYTVDADAIVHGLLSPETQIGKEVLKLLGPGVLVNGYFDRTKIAELVFNHPPLLRSLEKILHPAVYNEIEKQYQQVKRSQSHPLFAVEVPLLFESAGENDYDCVVTVVSDEKLCRSRFYEKTGKGAEEFSQRAARQMPSTEKAQRADYIILNNGDREALAQNVKKLYPILIGNEPQDVSTHK